MRVGQPVVPDDKTTSTIFKDETAQKSLLYFSRSDLSVNGSSQSCSSVMRSKSIHKFFRIF